MTYTMDFKNQAAKTKTYINIPLMLYKYSRMQEHGITGPDFNDTWNKLIIYNQVYTSDIVDWDLRVAKSIKDVMAYFPNFVQLPIDREDKDDGVCQIGGVFSFLGLER